MKLDLSLFGADDEASERYERIAAIDFDESMLHQVPERATQVFAHRSDQLVRTLVYLLLQKQNFNKIIPEEDSTLTCLFVGLGVVDRVEL